MCNTLFYMKNKTAFIAVFLALYFLLFILITYVVIEFGVLDLGDRGLKYAQ